MNSRWRSTLCVLLLAAGAGAQEQVFKARTELVQVSAIVTDKSGAHVKGLKPEDFVVLEDGKPRKVAVFEEVQTQAAPLHRTTKFGTEFTNHLAGEQGRRRLTLMVLDVLNTPVTDQVYGKAQLVKFLSESVQPGDVIGVFVLTRNGIKVVHDFTTDTEVLIKALKRSKDNAQMAPDDPESDPLLNAEVDAFQAMQLESAVNFAAFQRRMLIQMTLGAMQQLARAVAGIPGRKSLVWASAGFPFTITDPSKLDPNSAQNGFFDIASDYERTWRELNTAQVAVYPVDLRGLVGVDWMSASQRPITSGVRAGPQAMAAQQRFNFTHQGTLDTFKTFADATGGRAFYNRNDLDKSFQEAADDSTQYYQLGYYLEKGDTKSGWRKLQVKVGRPGVHVRSRTGFLMGGAPETGPRARRLELAQAMGSPLDFTAIELKAKIDGVTPGEGDKKKVAYEISFPAGGVDIDESDNNHTLIDYAAAALREDGSVADQFTQTWDGHLKPETLAKYRQGGINYLGELKVPAGEYTVRFVVRDGLSGRVGSVSGRLSVK